MGFQACFKQAYALSLEVHLQVRHPGTDGRTILIAIVGTHPTAVSVRTT